MFLSQCVPSYGRVCRYYQPSHEVHGQRCALAGLPCMDVPADVCRRVFR